MPQLGKQNLLWRLTEEGNGRWGGLVSSSNHSCGDHQPEESGLLNSVGTVKTIEALEIELNTFCIMS